MAKIQPAPKKIYFQIAAGKAIGYIDLSLAASVTNRRFYRQGINWAIGNVKLMSLDTKAQAIGVQTIQDSWMASNAWTKAFKAWQRMQREFALDEQPSVMPKYNDFKIFMDDGMYDDWKAALTADPASGGFQKTSVDALGLLMPANFFNPVAATAIYEPGEWDYSKLVVPNTGGATNDDWYMHMHGPDVPAAAGVGQVGLIHNYAKSRSVPQSPDPQTGILGNNIFTGLFDEGTIQSEAVLDDMLVDNDEVPYDLDEYPGGATNALAAELVNYDGFSATNNSGVLQTMNTGPFNAQCGLIKIQRVGTTDLPLVIEVTLVPGNHRGYLCQTMEEV